MSTPDDSAIQPALGDRTDNSAATGECSYKKIIISSEDTCSPLKGSLSEGAPEKTSLTQDHDCPRSDKLEATVIEAIKEGDVKTVEEWIKIESDRLNEIVDDSEKQVQSGYYHCLMRKGMTALHYAALYSKKNIVEALLKAGADPGVKNAEGEDVILFSVQNDNDDSAIADVLSLIFRQKRNHSLNVGNKRQETPLYFAAMKHRPKTIRLLLKHGADPEVKSESGKNTFHIACQHIDEDSEAAEIVKLLLHKRTPSLDERENVHHRTPLHFAARKFMAKTMRVLIKHGADATLKDNGKCPIHVAISTTSSTSFERMMACLRRNIEEKEGDGRTILHLAVIQNKLEYARILMDKGYERLRTIKDKSGKYPIDYACEQISPDFEEMVQLLYTSANKYKPWEVTPLQRIAQKNDPSLLEILLRYGADLQQKTYGKRTLIHFAAVSEEGSDEGFEKLIELLTTHSELVKRPLDINDRDEKGNTALQLSLQNRMFSRVPILLRKGADPSIPNDVMKNSLHIAFENCAGGSVIRELLEKCHDIDAMKDQHGKIPIQYLNRGTPLSAIKAVDHITPAITKPDIKELFSIIHKGDSHEQRLLMQIEGARFGAQQLYVEAGLMSCQQHYYHSKEKKNDDSQVLEFQDVSKSDADESTLLLRIYDTREKTKIYQQTRYNVGFKFDDNKAVCTPVPLLDAVQESPLKVAIDLERTDIVELLLVKGTKVDRNTFMDALKSGYMDLVQIFVRHLHESHLDALLNEVYTHDETKKLTTPFRELVNKCPGAAKEALQRNFKSEDKSVTFDYSLLEPWHPIMVRSLDKKGSMTSVLKLMVNNKRVELLEHPVIGSFLHIKWNKIGFWYYLFTFLLFGGFLISLSLFSLLVNRPQDALCQNRANSTGLNECGARGQLPLAFIFAIVTIALAVVLEILQLIRYRWAYFKELRNYGELLLYILSIIHAFVFFNECGCPLVWQWQIGIFAVLLGWMNLIAYAARFPRTGIYVLIFYKILTTFLKLISFSILLVLGFSVILFMTFNDPNSETSYFSNLGHSFVTVLSEEASLELFNLEVPPSNYIPIPYHASAFIIFIIFFIMLPILLNNMLVSLAVGDTEEIIRSAKLKKLDLQVRTVLQAEKFLPCCVLRCLDPEPKGNDDDTMREEDGIELEEQTSPNNFDEVKLEMDGEPEVETRASHAQNDPPKRSTHPRVKMELDDEPSVWKRAWRSTKLFIWGGKDYLEQVKMDEYHEERDKERKQIEGSIEDDDENSSEDTVSMRQLFSLIKSIEKKLADVEK